MNNRNTHLVIFSGDSLGLENDALILKNAMTKLYAKIDASVIMGRESSLKKITKLLMVFFKKLTGKTLLFIHLEELQSKLLWMSNHHFLVPNQEWFRSHTEKNVRKNTSVKILCKTSAAMNAFSDFDERCYYLGFASLNRYKKEVKKDYQGFLHLAGKSEKKGTMTVIDAWKKHPEWPTLTLKTSVLQHIEAAKNIPNIELITANLDQKELVQLMNRHGIHLCISEVEGFGHYIAEALSTGAIVVTTNAAPMNELVTKDSGFLINSHQSYQQYRAKCYQASQVHLEKVVAEILLLSANDLRLKSRKAKERYFQIEYDFEYNLNYFLSIHFPCEAADKFQM